MNSAEDITARTNAVAGQLASVIEDLIFTPDSVTDLVERLSAIERQIRGLGTDARRAYLDLEHTARNLRAVTSAYNLPIDLAN